MRYLSIILILWANISFASQVLVIVGDEAITDLDVEKRVEAIRLTNPNVPVDNNVRKQILNSLLSEKLFINEAKRLKISVSDEEVMGRFKNLQADYNLSDAHTKNFINNKSLWQQVYGQLLTHKLINIIFYNKVKASDAEIREEQKVKKGDIKEVTFKQIIFDVADLEKVNKLREESTNCQNFEQYAQELGFSKPSQNTLPLMDLNHELQALVRNTNSHKLSEVSDFNRRKQAIMVCHKNILNDPQNIDEIKQDIIARKINAEAQKYLAELKKRTYIEYIK